jgi:hypothetical protein
VVKSERKGNLMIYSVVDPSIFDLLQVAKEMLTRSLFGAQELLADLETVEFSVDRKSL